MKSTNTERVTSKIIGLGLASVTIAVYTQATDPVNVTKLFLLGGFAFAALGAAAKSLDKNFFLKFKLVLIGTAIFAVCGLITLLMSNAPFLQSFYGAYGRNNGYLMYFLLSLIFVATLTFRNRGSFNIVLLALGVAGLVNVIYALWVMAFGDFVGWNNQYGNLLGTLGNPNFIGSFFGMFSALLFSFLLSPRTNRNLRFGALALLPLAFLGIVESHAVQGKVLFISGFAIISLHWVRNKFSNPLISIGYAATLGFGFIVALLGTLQKGPLAEVLYKSTVSLRGEYWYAGWKTGLENPYFGAGFDSLGDWYRRSRRESALTFPGVDTITNASHNVFLDIFAFGGWPLLIGYLVIILAVIRSIIKFTVTNRNYDPIFISLTSVWLCYQLQSTISINQIGLAIWGWVFGAAIIAYESCFKDISLAKGIDSRKRLPKSNKSNANSLTGVVSPGLIAGLASVVGLILAVPPLSADMKWRSAQISRDVKNVELSLESNYLNPQTTFRYSNIVGVFETNGFPELAHTYAIKAVEFNKNSFESWRNLFQLSKSTDAERAEAIANMKRLDPLNTQVGKIAE